MSIFDNDGFGAEELAIVLGYADIMTQEERNRQRSLEENEPLVPDTDAPEWWEKD